jgi:CHAT domain-containing protein/tetratricopeptide (TPR) repeat protein
MLLAAPAAATIALGQSTKVEKPATTGENRPAERQNGTDQKQKVGSKPEAKWILLDLVTDGATVIAIARRAGDPAGGKIPGPNDLSFKPDDLAGARELAQEILNNRRKQLGEAHWRSTDARQMLKQISQMEKLAPAEANLLAEGAKLHGQGRDYRKQEKPDAALPVYERALQIRTQVLGWEVPLSMVCLNDLADCYQAVKNYAEAEPLYERSLAIHKKVLGEHHPDCAFVLSSLGDMYYDSGQYSRSETFLHQALAIRRELRAERPGDYAESLHEVASLRTAQKRYRDAEPLYREAIAIRKEFLGAQHPDYANSLKSLVDAYVFAGEYSRADPLAGELLEIRRKTFGENHPKYAEGLTIRAGIYMKQARYANAEPLLVRAMTIQKNAKVGEQADFVASLNNLATLYRHWQRYDEADALSEKALDAAKKILGEKHDSYVVSLFNLASVYDRRGRYALAEPLFEQAVALCKIVSGEKSEAYVNALSALAGHYMQLQEYSKAKPLLLQAATIGQKVLGEKHDSFLNVLQALASCYIEQRDYKRAISLQLQIVGVRREGQGERPAAYAHSLHQLAFLYQQVEEFGRAGPIYRRALEIQKESLGEDHRDYTATLHNLGSLYYDMEEYAQAEPFLSKGTAIDKKILGADHPRYATDLAGLATLYQAMGEYSKAYPLSLEAVRITRRHLQMTADAQSESEQLDFTRYCQMKLNRYLTIGLPARANSEEQYGEVLAWKGMVWARQMHIRQLRDALRSGDSETSRLVAQLANARRQLAATTLSQARFGSDGRSQKANAAIIDEIEKLEKALAHASAPYRRQLEQRSLTPEKLRHCLPPNAVLVDFLEYWHHAPRDATGPGGDEPCLTAFVIRRGRPIVRVELGATAPISQLVARWRDAVTSERRPSGGDPAVELRRLVWEPLGPHVDDAELVLVSPDESLGRIPFAALPAKEPGKFLIEEKAIAVIAVPQLLPELLAQPRPDEQNASALLIGDVDFNAAAFGALLARAAPNETPPKRLANADERLSIDRTAPRGLSGEPQSEFRPLPGSGPEITAIEGSFRRRYPGGQVTKLRGADANQNEVRRQASRHRYVHLATHGFFADPSVPRALAANAGGQSASGIMAIGQTLGAGLHPGLLSGIALAGANRPTPADDGILTALEVADLDLAGVDLVTLSACGTGLGKAERAEGLQGLQRAFQVAGARTVVATLWDVPDQATQLFMQRFYENLWQKQKSKLDALREAQFWLMKEMPRNPDVFRSGLVRPPAGVDEPGRYIRYWAAFVLSGDWR